MPFDEDAEGDERREDAIRSAASAAEPPSLVDERDAAPLDASGKDPAAAMQSKRKSKKMLLVLIFALCLFIVLGVGAYFILRAVAGSKSEQTLKVGGGEERAAGAPSAPNNDEKLEAALNVLASRDTKAAGAHGATAVVTDPGAVDQSGLGASSTNLGPNGQAGAGEGAGLRSETVGVERGSGGPFFGGDTTGGGARQVAGAQPTPAQPGSAADDSRGGLAAVASSVSRSVPGIPARSVLHSPRKDAASAMPTPSSTSTGTGEVGRAPGGSTAASPLTLPSFGAMLPVKSLGAIYTLRSSGGVVRFEVAYEKRGKGWVIPKGTEIVGVVRGSDRDRAFITMTGMIDPQTGKFVKLAGDLLGADGATGVRGERKRLSSRWASFFGRLRDAGLSSIGAAAGAIGRGPIIITDVYRRSSSPLTSELNGVLGADRDGFVLIKAGTTGYIYITQMPDEIHGLQELASLSRDSIGALADTARQRAATGISEDKLAEILTRGDAEDIRRAFADMTPEMQRVAEAFLRDAEAR
ncbi:MAG TPA: hypothetical protein VFS10_01325 [Pyrinomonadaceae bacterium]|nr:hypothetical protein [Pyrinomonadaceae bacterium]